MKDPFVPLASIVGIAVLAIGAYFYWAQTQQPPPVPPAQVEQTSPPADKAESEIRHPLAPAPPTENTKPLPTLEDSDGGLQQALAELIGRESLTRYFVVDSLVRRIVVTVDALPQKNLPAQYDVAQPVAGKFLAAGQDDKLSINFENYRRYTPYVRLAESLDTKKLVAVYKRFYPLLQQEYKNLAHPTKYFNDRVVEAIDDLLDAPDIKGVVRLVRPKVFYQFADPDLEALSAGQKIMVRMGNDNATRLKVKLRELRQQLTAAG